LDYLIKPFSWEEVSRSVQKALAFRTILVENLALKRQVEEPLAHAEVIGSSPAWKLIRDLVEQVAPSRGTVLVTGESGTGKELIARLIHRLSPRVNKPFITLNAAALPDTLLEAELFGYEKGAFTGALQRKPGRFELAHEGTLFLDEIGELPAPAQAKLLRVLQEGTLERLGGTKTLSVDVRIVAATHRVLKEEIDAQRFREDLYYRINVIAIPLPPLRERREDIPLLIHYFLQKHARQNHKELTAVQQDALRRLHAYDWPGNVRELENVIERAVILTSDATIGVPHLPPHLQDRDPAATVVARGELLLPENTTLAHLERLAITQTLERCGGNRQAAAKVLDIGIATLYRKIKEYHLPSCTRPRP
jgi:DNA-binding NtrC family response regulator